MHARGLSISLFGPTLFRQDGHPIPLGLKGTTLELLWYLVSKSGHEIRRECVADQFWQRSSEARQRSALNSAIWRIGKKLPRHPGLRLCTTDTTLGLTIDGSIPVDTRDLCALVHEACGSGGLMRENAERLAAALAASEAPFMDGIDADWTLAEREQISSIRIRGMIALMHWHGDNRNYEDALRIGRRLLLEDPFRESVQIDMMWLYVLNGQRAQAIKQYQAFAAFLREELSIEPMVETRALYEHIRTGLDNRLDGGGEAGHKQSAHQGLALVLAAVGQSRYELYQTLRTQLG
jgi:DNA-binding SARP family transcriptional activator